MANIGRFGTYGLHSGFNVQPGLELERIRQRDRELMERRKQFAAESEMQEGASLVDRMFRERADKRAEGQDVFMRGLKQEELEQKIAERRAMEASKRDRDAYERQQDEIRAGEESKRTSAYEEAQAAVRRKAEGDISQRELEQVAETQAEQVLENVLQADTSVQDDNIGDAEWEQRVLKSATQLIRNPDAPGAMAMRRALTRKAKEAAATRADRRKQAEQQRKQADTEAKGAEKERGQQREAKRKRDLLVVDDELNEVEDELERVEGYAYAKSDLVDADAQKAARERLGELQKKAKSLRERRRALLAEE